MTDPVAYLDLTTLDDDDTPDDVRALCAKAQTPRGPVAAVCILPHLAPVAVEALQGTPVKVATVANFPDGAYNPEGAAAAAAQAATSGGCAATSVFQSWNPTLPDWPPGRASIPTTCSQLLERIAAGSSGRASFWVETMTARAPLSSRICWWSRSVLVV
jgi:hypothetical protein